MVLSASAQSLESARKLFLTGKYPECLEACDEAQKEVFRGEEWRLLQAETLFMVGRYQQAELVVSNSLERVGNSVRLRSLGVDTANFTGQTNVAIKRLREINQLVASRPWAYREPADVVALGRVALKLGADPKSVLERLYNVAQKADPELRDSWLASGELALDKNDYALAAQTFTEGLKKFPDDADLLCGLARAYLPNARPKALELLAQALEKNENHIPSMLLLADHAVDAEDYGAAEKLLARVVKVNPSHPLAWAYRAVLAHLRNDAPIETAARASALRHWTSNPEVDHLIGLKLAQKYRFAEGSAYQRKALVFDPEYLPAQTQLAEDLLRLGEEAEGWGLAEAVHQRDGYDVTAYNLHTLHGTLQKFQTLTNADFVLRMSPAEAALYGDRALSLLMRAKAQLTEKYGMTLESPTVVEIFPEQKDFGVRTFGLPHNPGFLGVCFGRVITANSPASQGANPANWEAVLWHEFCHVVTLQMTKNKMPRWLSEGISVYEELQANPAWGQSMNPRNREMVLGDDLTPVSELSSVFLTAKSDQHVQFAYYQSALVVEFLVKQFGFEKLKLVLRDLGEGVEINEAIAKRMAPLNEIEKGFTTFAHARAEGLAPGLDWEKPAAENSLLRRLGLGGRSGPDADGEKPMPVVAQTNQPSSSAKIETAKASGKPNFWALMEQAIKLTRDKKWEAAKVPLNALIQHYPEQSGPDNAYAMLAAIERNLKNTAGERAALSKWAELDSDALEAYLRLIELAEADGDWQTVTLNARRCLAVNPLLPQPYRALAQASAALGDTHESVNAYRKLLLLAPPDPAEVHFRLGRLLQKENPMDAKRQVLLALEEAPRFREAHRLLLELASATTTNNIPEVQP